MQKPLLTTKIAKILSDEYKEWALTEEFFDISAERIFQEINKSDLESLKKEISISKAYKNKMLEILEVTKQINESDIELCYWSSLQIFEKISFREKIKILFNF